MLRILFVGEGVTDVGDEKSPCILELAQDGTQEDGEEPAPRGVVPILVLRALRKHCKGQLPDIERHSAYLRRLHGGGFARKVKAAIADAVVQEEEADAVVVVVDRGGQKNKDRLKEMREGVTQAANANLVKPVAIGLAIEELEAWLIADGNAVGEVRGRPLNGASPAPEGIRDPKSHLANDLGVREDDDPAWQRHETLAELADLDEIAKRCPEGFKPFRDEALNVLGPLLASDRA